MVSPAGPWRPAAKYCHSVDAPMKMLEEEFPLVKDPALYADTTRIGSLAQELPHDVSAAVKKNAWKEFPSRLSS